MTSGDVLEKATACGITACEVTAREITVYGAFRDTACEITAFGVTAFASEGTAIEDTQDGVSRALHWFGQHCLQRVWDRAGRTKNISDAVKGLSRSGESENPKREYQNGFDEHHCSRRSRNRSRSRRILVRQDEAGERSKGGGPALYSRPFGSIREQRY